MTQHGVDALIVPRADEYQNEYVPPSDERVRFLSGFTGSAATCAITQDSAALFTDGRYTIQAKRQLDLSVWTLRHSVTEPLADWLTGTLPAEARVGFVPALHRAADIAELWRKLDAAGLALVALEANPVDAIWPDRPAQPNAPARPHPEALAGETVTDKLARVGAALRKDRADALLTSAPDALCWLFNLRGDDVGMTPLVFGRAVTRSDGTATLLLADGKLAPEDRAALERQGVTILPPDALPQTLCGLHGKTVRLDKTTATVALERLVEGAGAQPDIGSDPVMLMKACKNAAELDGMRAAHLRDGAALTRFLHWLRTAAPGDLTEWEAAEKLARFRQALPEYRSLSFPTISATAANAAEAHYQMTEATAAPLRDGDLYLVDSGAQYADGTTDVTRTTILGTPTDEMRRRYTQVLRGHVALCRQRFPKGVTGAQLDPVARQFLWDDGVDFDHGTGHGVGACLGVHEGPQSISARGTGTPLEPGMIVSIEPGFYKAGGFGIRIENLGIVREVDAPPLADRTLHGFEMLTLAPYDRRLIDTALLAQDDIGWVDAYHAEVAARLAPLLDGDALDFLQAETAPL
ncbi:aminopeptidase P family protein [Rhodobacteraceae bacterium ASV31]|nr:aminopeptidase P family protein [Anianabacter salinae]